MGQRRSEVLGGDGRGGQLQHPTLSSVGEVARDDGGVDIADNGTVLAGSTVPSSSSAPTMRGRYEV